jgi:hypothetical protein
LFSDLHNLVGVGVGGVFTDDDFVVLKPDVDIGEAEVDLVEFFEEMRAWFDVVGDDCGASDVDVDVTISVDSHEVWVLADDHAVVGDLFVYALCGFKMI